MVSVIIITYNRPADLLELLQSLVNQENPGDLAEVLILNNASTISYKEVEKYIDLHPELKARYIFSNENLGISRGRNQLMQMAQSPLLLVLDDDVVIQGKDAFQKAARVFDKPFFREANTAIVTFRVIYYQTKEQQRTALPHKLYEEYRDKDQFLTYYFSGCAHVLKKEILSKTGLYPEDFFYGMEEYDLSYRVIREGYSLGYDAGVTFEHKESPLGRQPQFEKLSSQWVNKSKVARRYLPGIYYYTTMIAWSFEYLRKIRGHWDTYFNSWKLSLKARRNEKRQRLDRKAMDYLRRVKARLLY